MGLGTTTQEASSFGFLAPYGPLYLRLATVAERALAVDPSLTLVSLRQLAEAFAKHAAGRAGLIGQHDTQLAQVDLVLVQRLHSALANVARLRSTVTRALLNAERVEQATLARAFRGELVNQDPTDEPAARLLERIHSEITADARQTSGRKRAPRSLSAADEASG